MSFWNKLFGVSKKNTQLMEEPEHELAKMPPDDLMVTKTEEKKKSPDQIIDSENNIKDKEDNFNNKDSP